MKYVKIFALLITCAVVFTGCSIAKPMTKSIDRNASMVGNISDFQYYVSRNIVLTKVQAADVSGEVSSKGNLKVTKNRDVIQVTSGTCGALLKTEISDNGYKVYYIAFEADNDNCLKFIQNTAGDDKKIYLCYDRPHTHQVLYGGDLYHVEWDGINALRSSKVKASLDNALSKFVGFFRGTLPDDKDAPYLKVKMNVKINEKEKYRKASGRKVQ